MATVPFLNFFFYRNLNAFVCRSGSNLQVFLQIILNVAFTISSTTMQYFKKVNILIAQTSWQVIVLPQEKFQLNTP